MRGARAGRTAALLVALATGLAGTPAAGDEHGPEITGEFSAETRLFAGRPLNPGQRRHTASLFGEIELYYDWGDAVFQSLTVKPFFRWDAADDERTHFDLREAFWLGVFDESPIDAFELRAGVGKVFWGVAESRHLVDIVNQTDLVEYQDGEEKLGQPMVWLSLPRDWGVVDLFWLPYFRERTFPGRRGRLRGAPVVDEDAAIFESGARRWHQDFATRYSHTVDILDFGVSWFHGTARDPAFQPGLVGGRLVLRPVYQVIDQVGLDFQITTGPWLFKSETAWRAGQDDATGRRRSYFATVTGGEYTFFNIQETNIDLGLLAEYLFDERGRRAGTIFQNDIFAGLRLAFNDIQDTTILLGGFQELGSDSRSVFLEASRRFGDSWTLTIEAGLFIDLPARDPAFGLRGDDFIQIGWTYSF